MSLVMTKQSEFPAEQKPRGRMRTVTILMLLAIGAALEMIFGGILK